MKYQLKIGTLVLLYENNPEEVWSSNTQEKQKRLYQVTGLNSFLSRTSVYGRIAMVHHQDARSSSEIKLIGGSYKNNEEFRSGIIMLHTQFKALVSGVDFEINDLGEIKRLK